jgi:hypothetical protein
VDRSERLSGGVGGPYHWNRPFWDWAVSDVAGVNVGSHWGESVHFFQMNHSE